MVLFGFELKTCNTITYVRGLETIEQRLVLKPEAELVDLIALAHGVRFANSTTWRNTAHVESSH